MQVKYFQWIEDLNQLDLSADVCQFLSKLNQPTMIYIKGKTERLRVLSTLMHGDEPSGIKAVFTWLKQKKMPLTNVLIIISSIQAALYQHPFTHRMMPDCPDINRCFMPPYDSPVAKLAEEILMVLRQIDFEVLVDIHNTSGNGPPFAICRHNEAKVRSVASLFCQTLIHAELDIGSLLECGFDDIPIIGIECGGKKDTNADNLALQGVTRYLSVDNLFALDGRDCHVLEHPCRLELAPNTSIEYTDQVSDADVVMPANADELNLKILMPGSKIMHLKEENLAKLKIRGVRHAQSIEQYFELQQHTLVTKQAMRLFMATTDIEMATKDCLFYFVTL